MRTIEPFYPGPKSEGAPLVNAKDEALRTVVNIVYYTRAGTLVNRLIKDGARDAVCSAARRGNEKEIFLALESASRLNFQVQKEGTGLALKDQENIMFMVSLCNATENFCSHYNCVGDPNDRLDINIDDNTVEEDLSCEGVDKETCIERAAQNLAKAQLLSDEDDQMKTFIVNEWYRVPGNRDDWKLNIVMLGLSAAHIRADNGELTGEQDPNSPLKLMKVFDLLGRDDCCKISDDMLDHLYDRKDVVRYIVDTLYDHNPNFLYELKEKEVERRRKEDELIEEQKSFAAEIVDLFFERSKPKDGEDYSYIYEGFVKCLWALADKPGSSLLISDVMDMLEKNHDKDELTKNFPDIIKAERQIVEYMVLTLQKDFGVVEFSEKLRELQNNKACPPIAIYQDHDATHDTQVLVDQLLAIKKKNFELFRYAVFNVLLPQSRSPDETFGIISYALSCREWNDSCLHKLAERNDVMHMIIFDLFKRDGKNPPITTKERLKEELDQVLYGASVTTFDPRAVIKNVKYFIFIILIVALILMYKSWQNQKRLEEEKKMREAEEARKKEKKAKRKKRQ